jgi:DNA-binding winged helix-turn-helix (wHTH) protein/DNA-binding CsgD family transcriptional regulator
MSEQTAAVGRVDLAHEPDFEFGSVMVRPALREIRGSGWLETLEPRVMQVLVALARAKGDVVSRDDLIRKCWSGRAVSDDVIYRCVSELRRILDVKHGACTVRTVPRVGYRLSFPSPEGAPEAPRHPSVNAKLHDEALSELIGHIYDCAIDPAQWDEALAHMVSLLSPADWDVAVLMWESIAPPRARFVGATGLSGVARDIYAEAFAGRSIWSAAIATLGPGRVVDTDEVVARSEFLETPLYKNFLSTWRMEIAVMAILDRADPELLGLVMPGPSGRDLSGLKFGLRLLTPHIQRAVRISRSLGEANLRAEGAETALDRAPVAIATLTSRLSVMNLNAKALALAESGELAIRDGILSFADPQAQQCLAQLAAAEGAASTSFRIRDRNGEDVTVLAARLKTQFAPSLTGNIEGASVILLIGMGERAPLLEINRLGDRFGLSATEARLSTALAAGDNLRSYATRRNMSMNAIKFLLKNVYHKTETRSLEELVCRVRQAL